MQPAPTRFIPLGLAAVTWPILVENVLRMLLMNVDTIMLSQYSEKSVAAVGAVNQILGMLFLFYGIIAGGTSILLAQLLGARNEEGARQTAGYALALNMGFGVLLSIFMVIFAPHIVCLLNLPLELHQDATIFLRILGGSSFMQSILATAAATLRSFGLTKVSMVAMIAMNILNVLGNALVLKTSLPLGVTGVAGVACSSAIAQTLIAMGLFGYLITKVGIRCRPGMLLHADRTLVRNIYRIGLPSTGENICYQASQIMITYIITFMGTQALTVRVITFNLMWLIMVTSMSLSQGTQIIVGHRVGAHHFDLAYHLCFRSLKAGLVISSLMALLMYSISVPILGIFSSDPTVIHMSRMLLLVAILIEPGRVFNMVIIGSLKATGDVRFPAVVGVLSMFLLAVGLSYLLGIHFKLGLVGVWLSFAADEWFRAIFMTHRWRSRIWQTKVLTQPPPMLVCESAIG